MGQNSYVVVVESRDMKADRPVDIPAVTKSYEQFPSLKKAFEYMQDSFPDSHYDRDVVKARKYDRLIERVSIYELDHIRSLMTKTALNGYELLGIPPGVYIHIVRENLNLNEFEKLVGKAIASDEWKGKNQDMLMMSSRHEIELPPELQLKRRPPPKKEVKGFWNRLKSKFL